MTADRIIYAALALLDVLVSYRVNVRELVQEWEDAKIEGRSVDVARFREQAQTARDELEQVLGDTSG